MARIKDLIRIEEEVMTIIGQIVWTFEDVCSSCIFTEFYRPLHKRSHHSAAAVDRGVTNPQEAEEHSSQQQEEEDTNEMLNRYYQQTMMQVSEFAETILYSILFYKWIESRNDGIIMSASPSQWKDSLPNHLRRATRQKANRIICSLMGITRLRLDALDFVHEALHKAEELANRYIERRGDYILDPVTGEDEQKAALDRMEEDAINYVNRQIKTQLKIRQPQANQELYNAMTDMINTSIENQEYCQRLHRWAQRTVELSNVAQWNTSPKARCNTDSSSETSATDIVEESESNHTPPTKENDRGEYLSENSGRNSSTTKPQNPVRVICIK